MPYSVPSLPRQRGFTLLESALTIVIVGVGIVSIFELFGSMTRQNAAVARATTAMFLANNVQEMLADLPFNDPSGAGFGTEEGGGLKSFDDVDDFHGWTSNPGAPVDSLRNELPELKNFAQRVTVTHVSVDAPTSNQIGTEAARVTVRVFYGWTANDPGQELYKMSWIVMRR